jgi:hypothetical protein
MFLENKERPVREYDNFTAISESVVYTVHDAQYLTGL